jgi:hypothetical protein
MKLKKLIFNILKDLSILIILFTFIIQDLKVATEYIHFKKSNNNHRMRHPHSHAHHNKNTYINLRHKYSQESPI